MKAAAGMRNADSNGHGHGATPFAISHVGIGNGGGILPNPIENGIPMDGPQQTVNGRRKLYFSAGRTFAYKIHFVGQWSLGNFAKQLSLYSARTNQKVTLKENTKTSSSSFTTNGTISGKIFSTAK